MPVVGSIPTRKLDADGRTMARENRPRRQLSEEDRRYFRSFKMTKPQFMYLLDRIKPLIMKRTPDYNLLPRQKLAICLRYFITPYLLKSCDKNFSLQTNNIRLLNLLRERSHFYTCIFIISLYLLNSSDWFNLFVCEKNTCTIFIFRNFGPIFIQVIYKKKLFS